MSGCAYKPFFKPINGNMDVQEGASIAVICGIAEETNVKMASYISESLSEVSRFHVLSQKSIASKIKGYPVRIHGPYADVYFEIETDFSKTDREKLSKIQKKLGVDYLYVIWAPFSESINIETEIIHVVTQLFKAPGLEEVGQGRFYSFAQAGFSLRTKSPTSEKVDKGMRESCRYAAQELSQKTGMTK